MSETSYVQVEPDVAICVERWRAGAPGAPVVLALHGFSSNRLAFAGLAKAFDGAVDLVAVDCRGRGRSGAPDDASRYGMRRHADDAAAVLRHLGLTDVTVVGTSMGAWIATQVAAHHGDLVRSLVLVDGGYLSLLPEGTDRVAFIDLVLLGALERMDLVLPMDLDALVAVTSAAPQLGPLWDADVEASVREGFEEVEGGVRSRMRRLAGVADAESYNEPFEAPYLRADVAAITCPVHLITAPEGFPVDATTATAPVMPAEAVAELRAALPQLTVEEAPGTNHFSACLGSNDLVTRAVLERR